MQQIGRTGRTSKTDTGVSFVLADQAAEIRKIASGLGLEAEFGQPPRGGVPECARGSQGQQ